MESFLDHSDYTESSKSFEPAEFTSSADDRQAGENTRVNRLLQGQYSMYIRELIASSGTESSGDGNRSGNGYSNGNNCHGNGNGKEEFEEHEEAETETPESEIYEPESRKGAGRRDDSFNAAVARTMFEVRRSDRGRSR